MSTIKRIIKKLNDDKSDAPCVWIMLSIIMAQSLIIAFTLWIFITPSSWTKEQNLNAFSGLGTWVGAIAAISLIAYQMKELRKSEYNRRLDRIIDETDFLLRRHDILISQLTAKYENRLKREIIPYTGASVINDYMLLRVQRKRVTIRKDNVGKTLLAFDLNDSNTKTEIDLFFYESPLSERCYFSALNALDSIRNRGLSAEDETMLTKRIKTNLGGNKLLMYLFYIINQAKKNQSHNLNLELIEKSKLFEDLPKSNTIIRGALKYISKESFGSWEGLSSEKCFFETLKDNLEYETNPSR